MPGDLHANRVEAALVAVVRLVGNRVLGVQLLSNQGKRVFQRALAVETELRAARPLGEKLDGVGLEDGLGVPEDLQHQGQKLGAAVDAVRLLHRSGSGRDAPRHGMHGRRQRIRAGQLGLRQQSGNEARHVHRVHRYIAQLEVDHSDRW